MSNSDKFFLPFVKITPPYLYSVFLDNFSFELLLPWFLTRFNSPERRFTVHDENVGPVVAESDDSTSEEVALSDKMETERLIS